jgi:carboxylate-amine ligase
MMEELEFARSDPYTLGVELEFQVLDQESLDLVPRAEKVFASLLPDLQDKVAREFLQSIFEIHTDICRNTGEVEADLRQSISLAEHAADACSCFLFAAGIHPFASPSAQRVTDDDRYQRIMDDLQYVGRQFISQGLHVHVGMPDRETAILVTDIIQGYLPLLLALSACSPYFAGEDTGFSSFRTKLFEALPLAGIPDFLGSWQAYETEVRTLHQAGIITQLRDLWWDARPSPYFGTVEIRICDMPCKFKDIMTLTALVQALAVYIAEGNLERRRVNPQFLRYNKWQACRYGLAGTFCDPFLLITECRQTLASAAGELLAVLEPVMERLGSAHWGSRVREILEQGTGADRQRRYLAEHGTLRRMIVHLNKEFWS